MEFDLSEMEKAYDTVARAAESGAVEVVLPLTRWLDRNTSAPRRRQAPRYQR
jgi:hypothetical protein